MNEDTFLVAMVPVSVSDNRQNPYGARSFFWKFVMSFDYNWFPEGFPGGPVVAFTRQHGDESWGD